MSERRFNPEEVKKMWEGGDLGEANMSKYDREKITNLGDETVTAGEAAHVLLAIADFFTEKGIKTPGLSFRAEEAKSFIDQIRAMRSALMQAQSDMIKDMPDDLRQELEGRLSKK